MLAVLDVAKHTAQIRLQLPDSDFSHMVMLGMGIPVESSLGDLQAEYQNRELLSVT